MPPNGADGNGSLRIPRWAVLLVAGSVIILGAGFAAGQRIVRNEDHINTLDATINARMCRVEVALKIPPWPSCYTDVGHTVP